jgi:excinuclease ABC subunit A
VIEHNLQVMKAADWIIDLGPGAAERGGRLVCAGPPEEVAKCPESVTGRFLAEALARQAEPLAADETGGEAESGTGGE